MSSFPFIVIPSGILSKRFLLRPISLNIYPKFSSSNLWFKVYIQMILSTVIRFCVWYKLGSKFCIWNHSFSKMICWKDSFSREWFLACLSKTSWFIRGVDLFLGFLFCSITCLFLCLYHAILIVIALWYVLKFGITMPLSFIV